MSENPTSTDDPPTLEGIEVEHRLFVLVVVNLMRSAFWRCTLTVDELLGTGKDDDKQPK